MRFDVITIFPEMFEAITRHGITSRALDAGLWRFATWNPRDYASDLHRTVDDRPYGGGPGMVMMAEPLSRAISAAREAQAAAGFGSGRVVYLSPQGAKLDHARVVELSRSVAVTLLCGRYEGVDERVLEREVDEELSIGDYVLSGGEIAAMAVIDSIVRQIPGAVGDRQSVAEESFVDGLLDCPQYTRPERWPNDASGGRIPEVLLSGHHEQIRRWRLKQSLGRTWLRRPDLLEGQDLNDERGRLLEEFRQENRRDIGAKP